MVNDQPIERLALRDCLAAASRTAAKQAADAVKSELVPRLDRQDGAPRRQDETPRHQNGTLQRMWRQMKGNASLPIDE